MRGLREIRWAFVAVAVIGAVGWLACTGDDPATSSAEQGTEGGVCFPNGTCNTGLDCSANRCVPREADSGDAAADAGAGDATPDTSPPSCDFTPTQAAQLFDGGVHCGASGSLCTEVCCNDTQCKADAGLCPSAHWACEAPMHCPTTAPRCCMQEFAYADAATCPVELSTAPKPGSSCAGACPNGALRLCTTTADCDVGTCTAIKVTPTGNGNAIVVGACR
jgi:hypothetical protein